jgi:ribokinase
LGAILLNIKMGARELNFDPQKLRYKGIIGTGGIGSGKFFILNGDETLGREESRSGHFLDINDYCKQHIILHYVKVLLGSSFTVIPVGKIGDDDIGQILFNEMSETGFVMNRIEKVSHKDTLFSFCFYYPDGTGGNMTTDNSASAMVDADFIETAVSEIEKLGTKGIIIAVPEVPLTARQKLLELGRQNRLFCTASFTTEEMQYTLDAGIIKYVDLIAINIDEASAIASGIDDKTDTISIVLSSIQKLQDYNKNIMVSITAGKKGSWCWDGKRLNKFPAIKTIVSNTAGAGDAFFSGMLCGLALGLHIFDAQQLASIVAGLSITSSHTIHKGVDRYLLNKFMHTSDLSFSETIIKLLED